MRTHQKQKFTLTPRRQWSITTVLGCFLFVPGFIWILVLTVREAKTSIEQNRTILHCGLGALTFAVAESVYMLVFSLPGELGRIPFELLFPFAFSGLLGIYLLCVYSALSARNRRIRRCLLLVQQKHITSRALIGEILGLSERRTTRLLQRIIRMGRLDGAWLQEGADDIRFKKSVWARQRVICQSCGAELVVDLGRTLICDYCGGALQPGFFHWVPQDRE